MRGAQSHHVYLTNLVRRCPLLPHATGPRGPHSMGAHRAQCRCEERSGPVLSHGPETTVVTVGLCLPGLLGQRVAPILCRAYLGLLREESSRSLLGRAKRSRLQELWGERVGSGSSRKFPPFPAVLGAGSHSRGRWGHGLKAGQDKAGQPRAQLGMGSSRAFWKAKMRQALACASASLWVPRQPVP